MIGNQDKGLKISYKKFLEILKHNIKITKLEKLLTDNEKLTALNSIKLWAVKLQQYEFAIQVRDKEKILINKLGDNYIRVIKDVEHLNSEQKVYLIENINFKSLRSEFKREITLKLLGI